MAFKLRAIVSKVYVEECLAPLCYSGTFRYSKKVEKHCLVVMHPPV